MSLTRPYLGRYVEPAPRPMPAPMPLPERIAIMLSAARCARDNAHTHLRAGDRHEAAHAFFRAHSHIEHVRKLRVRQ